MREAEPEGGLEVVRREERGRVVEEVGVERVMVVGANHCRQRITVDRA